MTGEHHWSGWPGAFCLHCGAEDPHEIALADNDYDPVTQKWTSEEIKQRVEKAMICPGPFGTFCPQCAANQPRRSDAMKQIQQRKEEIISDTVEIHHIDIAGKRYLLRLVNTNGSLSLTFLDDGVEEFEIQIRPISGHPDRAALNFGRHESRPGHDHSDRQSLWIWRPTMPEGVPSSKIKFTWGRRCESEPFWNSGAPYDDGKDATGSFAKYAVLFGRITHGEARDCPYELDWDFI